MSSTPTINEIELSVPKIYTYDVTTPTNSPVILAIISTLSIDERDISVDTSTTTSIGALRVGSNSGFGIQRNEAVRFKEILAVGS